MASEPSCFDVWVALCGIVGAWQVGTFVFEIWVVHYFLEVWVGHYFHEVWVVDC